MRTRATPTRTDRVWTWPPGTAALAPAGLAGPLLFVLGVIIQQAYRGAAYSPIGQQISDLTAGGAGRAQQLTFLVSGLLIIAFAVGLHRGIATGRGGIIGPALLAVNGLNLVVAGVFPLRQNDAGVVDDPLGVHSVNGTVFFLSLGVPLIVFALRLRRDARWHPLAGYVLGTGIALVAAVMLVVTLVRPTGAPLHPWLGTAQRVIVVVWLGCLVTMALRLRRIANADRPADGHGTPAWVRKFGVATTVVIGLIGLMMFFGGRHGPGMHAGLAGIAATSTVAHAADR